MTARTGTRCIGVIKFSWFPRTGRMTGITLGVGLDMSTGFTFCISAVMTGTALTLNICMIKSGITPRTGIVARVALRRGLNVFVVFTRGSLSIMATAAGSDYRCMVYARHPVPHYRVMA